MIGDAVWISVITSLSPVGLELQTTTGLWFRASSSEGRLYVDRATEHVPSSNLSKQRTISRRDFFLVQSYYGRWANGETGIRHEVSRQSRNTAYIFALIEKFTNRR